MASAMMDNPPGWSARRVIRNMQAAEVISLFFPYVGRALIVDLRGDEAEGPFIATDRLISGMKEQLDNLRQLRPRFALPENITLAPWMSSVASFEASGALSELNARLVRMGAKPAQASLAAAYKELLALEWEETLALIRGDVQKTKTLYQR